MKIYCYFFIIFINICNCAESSLDKINIVISDIENKIQEIILLDKESNSYEDLYNSYMNDILYNIESIKDINEFNNNENLKNILFELKDFLLFNYLNLKENKVSIKKINNAINEINKNISNENEKLKILKEKNNLNKNESSSYINNFFIFIRDYCASFLNKISIFLNEIHNKIKNFNNLNVDSEIE